MTDTQFLDAINAERGSGHRFWDDVPQSLKDEMDKRSRTGKMSLSLTPWRVAATIPTEQRQYGIILDWTRRDAKQEGRILISVDKGAWTDFTEKRAEVLKNHDWPESQDWEKMARNSAYALAFDAREE